MKCGAEMLGILLVICTLFPSTCGKLEQGAKDRFVLEGIQIQLSGPVSNIVLGMSHDSRYKYVVTDANMASMRLNGISGQGYKGIEVSNRFCPEVEIEVRITKGTQMPVVKGKDGIARFDHFPLIAQGSAEARVVGKAETVSVANEAVFWTFGDSSAITVSMDDKGEYYYDFPKLVRDGNATVVGQDGKSVSFDDGTTVLTFKGNQNIPVSEDEQGRCYLDFPKFATQHGGLSIYLNKLQDTKGSDLTILKPSLYTEGSEHIILSDVECFGYRFSPDSDYPLVFKIVRNVGYAYICGRGTITTPGGTVHQLGYKDTIETWLSFLVSNEQLDREGASQALGWLARTK